MFTFWFDLDNNSLVFLFILVYMCDSNAPGETSQAGVGLGEGCRVVFKDRTDMMQSADRDNDRMAFFFTDQCRGDHAKPLLLCIFKSPSARFIHTGTKKLDFSFTANSAF